jgi:hypothetical protein
MSTLPAHIRGALKPLELTVPSISTSPGAAVQELEPLPIVSFAKAEDRLRKDSMDLLPLSLDHVKSVDPDESPCRRRKSPLTASTTPDTSVTTETPVMPNARAPGAELPDIEVLDNILYESRVFDNSDVLGFVAEFAKIDALPAEPSGQYENMLLPLANATLEPLNVVADDVERDLALVPFNDVTDAVEHKPTLDPFKGLTDAIKHKLALEPLKNVTDVVGDGGVEDDGESEEVEVS